MNHLYQTDELKIAADANGEPFIHTTPFDPGCKWHVLAEYFSGKDVFPPMGHLIKGQLDRANPKPVLIREGHRVFQITRIT